MDKKEVKIGDEFGELKVINSDQKSMWLCECSCGRPVRATSIELTEEKINSCCYCGWGKMRKNKWELGPIIVDNELGIIKYSLVNESCDGLTECEAKITDRKTEIDIRRDIRKTLERMNKTYALKI